MLSAAILAPAVARADEVDDFVHARDNYNNGDYPVAIDRFHELLLRRPPISPTVAEPVRKYLFAALVLTDHRDEAVRMLEEMLRENPDLQFAPRDFSGAVAQIVFDTRTRLAPELERLRAERFAAARAAQEAAERQRAAREAALVDALTRERVITRVPRPMMFIPLGIGQFMNGSYGLGALFLSLEVASLGTAVAGGIAFATLPPTEFRRDLNICRTTSCTTTAALTITGLSVFGAAVIAGIVQANLGWVPERVGYRRRPMPQLSFGPTPDGVSVGATWRF